MENIVSIDIETSCLGKAEFRSWRKGFQIDSIAASWRQDGEIVSWYSDSPPTIDAFIRRLAETQRPLLVHNLSFELGVFSKLYPDLTFNWAADTARLAQLRDNSGGRKWEAFTVKTADDFMDEALDLEDAPKQQSGFSLVACATRYLPTEFHNHKAVAHDWLEQNAGITKDHGEHLHLLPPDILRAYNIADTEVTLRLYEALMEELTMLDFDPAQDWLLYTTRCRLMQEGYRRGLLIDRDKLRKEIYATAAEIDKTMQEFFEATVDARREWAAKFPGKLKRSPKQPDEFNVGSNQQLAQLFIQVLGIVGGRTTKTGAQKVEKKVLSPDQAAVQYPSFASKHLEGWGPLGLILYKRRKLTLVLQQMLGTYMASEEDGRLHPEIRASGTSTNRVAGYAGGKE